MSMLARIVARDAGAGVVIEPMRRRHLPRILPIERASYPRPWSRSVFETELEQARRGARSYVVARRRRQLVGYAGVWYVDDPELPQAHVTNVAVAPAHRREGIATALLVELARRAIDHGCVAWTLEVRASSTGAQELYRRFGFAPAGVRARYYENTEDAIVMWCHDIDRPDYEARLAALAASAALEER